MLSSLREEDGKQFEDQEGFGCMVVNLKVYQQTESKMNQTKL